MTRKSKTQKNDVELKPSTEALVKWMVEQDVLGEELSATSGWIAAIEWSESHGRARELLDRAMKLLEVADDENFGEYYLEVFADYEAFKKEQK